MKLKQRKNYINIEIDQLSTKVENKNMIAGHIE